MRKEVVERRKVRFGTSHLAPELGQGELIEIVAETESVDGEFGNNVVVRRWSSGLPSRNLHLHSRQELRDLIAVAQAMLEYIDDNG